MREIPDSGDDKHHNHLQPNNARELICSSRQMQLHTAVNDSPKNQELGSNNDSNEAVADHFVSVNKVDGTRQKQKTTQSRKSMI